MNAETEIKKGRKFDQVVDGAARVFMREGFEGASVDMIAREAGVSKATLYSYFSDKKLLFLEVAQREITRQPDLALNVMNLSEPPRIVLRQFGMSFARLVLSKFGMSVLRVVIAETERFPEVGRAFFENGPKLMEARMIGYFEAAEARGELSIADKPFAAHQFIELCKANRHLHCILGVAEEPSDADIAYIVDGAVDMFLARYGT